MFSVYANGKRNHGNVDGLKRNRRCDRFRNNAWIRRIKYVRDNTWLNPFPTDDFGGLYIKKMLGVLD
jgi:hypothetical protein